MELHTSKAQIEWLCNECFPMMQDMNKARTRLHEGIEVEYWNAVIVGYVLQQIVQKFERKIDSKKLQHIIKMEPAEICTLYRFLFNYPIPGNQHWKISTRQFIIDQLHRLMKESSTEIHKTYFSS
jgi:hypothetical protein